MIYTKKFLLYIMQHFMYKKYEKYNHFVQTIFKRK